MIRISALLLLLIFPTAFVGASEIDCSEDSKNGAEIFSKSLSDAVLKSMNTRECQGLPLKVGQVMKFIRRPSWTGLSSSHAMKRIGENQYQAILNLNFVEEGATNTPRTLEMKKQVLGCIKMANKKISGPSGKVLEIRIIDPIYARGMPPTEVPDSLTINVLKPNLPSNMLNFSTMDCANITHEVFHMLGLVDEYDDSLRSSNGKQETCRIIPKRNTLMGLPSSYFEDVYGKTTVCNCGGTCQRFWNSTSPERRRYLEGQNDPCSQLQALKTGSFVEGTSTDAVSTLEGDKLTIIRKPKPEAASLMSANQFKKVLFGYCPVGIKGYQKCSSYSYFKRELSPGQANPQCADIPAECSQDDYYLGPK